jgi:hypothetical protein
MGVLFSTEPGRSDLDVAEARPSCWQADDALACQGPEGTPRVCISDELSTYFPWVELTKPVPSRAEAQIRALEAKLAEMKKGREALEGGGVDAADPSSSTKGEDSQLAVPPSSAGLPTKPSVL